MTVQVRTWEPSRRLPAGDNPSEQFHTLTFPALSLSSEFIRSRDIDQTQTITVTTTPDTNYEVRDTIRAEVVSVSHGVKTSQSKLEQTGADQGRRPPVRHPRGRYAPASPRERPSPSPSPGTTRRTQ